MKVGGWSVSGQLASGSDLSLNPPAAAIEGNANPERGPGLPESLLPVGPTIQLNDPQSISGAEELPAPRAVEGNLPTRTYSPRLVEKQDAQQAPSERDLQLKEDISQTAPNQTAPNQTVPGSNSNPNTLPREPYGQATWQKQRKDRSPVGQAFHCNSKSFSLDYSLNAAAGSALADVELWGTDDGGNTWQKWGSDPDRQSPFDVQVANDGLLDSAW